MRRSSAQATGRGLFFGAFVRWCVTNGRNGTLLMMRRPLDTIDAAGAVIAVGRVVPMRMAMHVIFLRRRLVRTVLRQIVRK